MNSNTYQSERNPQYAAETFRTPQRPSSQRDYASGNSRSGYDEVYLGLVLKLVHKSISASNAPNLTEVEAGQRARDWADLLWDQVPEQSLEPAFRRAVHEHASSFPITVAELIRGYRSLTENPERSPSGASLPEADVEKGRRESCERCFGTTMEHIFTIDGRIAGVRRIGSCDHRAFSADEPKLFRPAPAPR